MTTPRAGAAGKAAVILVNGVNYLPGHEGGAGAIKVNGRFTVPPVLQSREILSDFLYPILFIQISPVSSATVTKYYIISILLIQYTSVL
jgi:hypothetical protein